MGDGDRPAQDRRGEDEKGKTGFEANAAQTPEVEARIYRRRRAMLQAFMIVGRAMVFNVARAFNLPTRSKAATTSKGKGTGGARAAQLRKKQNRSAKRAAFLRRLVAAKKPAKEPPPAPSVPTRPDRPQGGAPATRGKPQPS